MTQQIIGLRLALEDPETGSSAEWHVLDSYHVYKYAHQTQATFATYVSQEKYAEGKSPVGRSLTVQLAGLPPGNGDVEGWIYLASRDNPSSGSNPEISPLIGAEVVYAE